MLIVRQPRPFDTFDRVFDQLTAGWGSQFSRAAARSSAPNVRADWNEGTLVLTVDLPGVPSDAVKVEVADRALTIGVEHVDQGNEFRWSRTLQLGGSLDADAVNARYADGRLTVTVPPAQKPAPRAITIDTAGSADETPAIEASAEG